MRKRKEGSEGGREASRGKRWDRGRGKRKYCFAVAAAAEGEKTRRGMLSKPPRERASGRRRLVAKNEIV